MTDTDTANRTATDEAANAWHPTACILCECNCGIEIRLGADGRTFERTRGDKAHPASKGYTCEKALRLDYYQNGRGERLLSPLRRRPDGTFEEIDWDTAIREVADRLAAVRDAHGGESIVYYGGGGQGNHLGGAYGSATLKALGVRFRANAISQEKTGEVLVMGKMFGTPLRGDFEHCEVAFFVGKNPWISHGIPHARTTLKAIAADPGRAMIVIDPRVTETAAMADFHLQVRSGRDAWLIAAMAAVLVDEGLVDREWLGGHASGAESVLAALGDVPISRYCEISGVDEALVRAAARRIAAAASVAVFEDLGVQMNRHSTLVSYLEKLVWLLTGNLAIPGGQYAMSSLGNLLRMSRAELDAATAPVSPVVGARLIGGLIPCNVMAEEILTDHPNRYRAMIVESGNPLHSVADSQRMREAMRALDVSICIDVFMTETARQSDYVLPATTQYEKFEATFFNFDFPKNVFQLRRPVLEPPDGPLPEPEIHARLVDALGFLDRDTIEQLRAAATRDREEFAAAFTYAMTNDPKVAAVAPVVLYRTLGETLPHGATAAAALWPMAIRGAQKNPDGVGRAGFGSGTDAGNLLFDAIVDRPSGVVFTDDAWEATWARIQTDDGLVHLEIPKLLDELAELRDEAPPGDDPDWPLLLSAGERRSFTANTILRDPAWRKKDTDGALRVSPTDADRFGLVDGDTATLTTKRASVVVTVAVDETVRAGHVSLPNGLGLDHLDAGTRHQTGVAPNELTASEDRDPWAGTPWHKTVPARLERVPALTFDVAQIDEVLATTRAVRRRLDLERPVDNQLLLDCIDLAEQAPTGGNLGSRRWIIVREQRVKDQLGELYRETALPFMSAAAQRLQGTGHPSEKVMASATYLAEHLAEVPAIVIPTVIGHHDGSGRPGLFDSVIQAAWSFCLALRARGLGTTWVTAALQDTAKVKDILCIPEHMTEIVLLPVAHTKGTEFKRAPRHPARSITYFDRFGTTTERGPSDELRFEDAPGAIAEVDIAASPGTVWSLVSDINLPAQFSNEFVGAEWASDDHGVGAMFHGRNQHPAIGEWTIPCFIDVCDEPRAFGWRTSDADNPGARWRFDLEPREGGTRLRSSYVMGPGPSGTTMAITNNPGKETRVLRRRINEVHANMQQTVEGVKQLAEAPR